MCMPLFDDSRWPALARHDLYESRAARGHVPAGLPGGSAADGCPAGPLDAVAAARRARATTGVLRPPADGRTTPGSLLGELQQRLAGVRSLLRAYRYHEALQALRVLEDEMGFGPVAHLDALGAGEGGVDALERKVLLTRCAYHAMVGEMALARERCAQWLARWEDVGDRDDVAAALLTLGYADYAMNDLHTARRLFLRAQQLQLAAGRPWQAWADALHAGVCLAAGDVPEAERILGAALAVAKHTLGTAANGYTLLAALYAEVCYEQGRLDDALRALDHLQARVDGPVMCHSMAHPQFVRARILFLRGRSGEADRLLRELASAARGAGVEGLALLAHAERVNVLVGTGSIRQAQQLAAAEGLEPAFEEAQRSGEPGPACWDPMALGLAVVHLMIGTGRLESAQRNLELMVRDARRGGRTTWLARLLCVQAQVCVRQRGRDEARQLVLEAAGYAAAGGLRRSLADRGPLVAQLLCEAVQLPAVATGLRGPCVSPEQVRDLLAALGARPCPGKPPEAAGARGTREPRLSPRELQILRLLDRGLRNQDVAERLFLSAGTVKWHLRTVYGKLQVGTRIAAIARARELGLLEPGASGDDDGSSEFQV